MVFLDLDADRYFSISADIAALFACAAKGAPDTDAGRLLATGLVVPSDADALDPVRTHAVACSALECAGERAFRAAVVPEVALLTLSTLLDLRHRPLKRILQALRARLPVRPAGRFEPDVLRHEAPATLARAFLAARRCVPVDMRCLPDSIAMVRFLARRGIATQLVFGVVPEPFAAHCWVQCGDLVLNDTVGHVDGHTAILVW